MLTDNRAELRTQDWFLIACDGDLVLKLAQDLRIGEDERGQTVLSPAKEDAMLRITSEHGCLTLQALAMDWTFTEKGGLSVQHLSFVEGLTLKLVFPNSSLLITSDFEAGAGAVVDREIRLTPTHTPSLSLSRVDEPVNLIEPAMLPAPESDSASASHPLIENGPAGNDSANDDLVIEEAVEQARAAEVLGRWEHEIPDELVVEQQSADTRPSDQLPPLRAPAVLAATDRTTRERPAGIVAGAPEAEPASAVSTRTHHRPLAGLIAVLAMLAPMCVFLDDTSKLGVAFSLTHYRPLSESTALPIQVDPAPPVHETPVQRRPVTVASQEVPKTQIVPEEVSARSEQERLLIASLLAEAKAYYQAGSIVTPVEANAVSNLTQLLRIDPGNEEGLRLMYMSAVTLIKEAEAAHAAGNDYLARNLVEDVLGFHPELDDARALLDSWTRVP